jgi:hypothetical protein
VSRVLLLLLAAGCAWSAGSDGGADGRTFSPALVCAGRTDPLTLDGLGAAVEGGLTASPALTSAVLALAPTGGLDGAAAPDSAPIPLVPADGAAVFRPLTAPVAGLWSVTFDGVAAAPLVVAPAATPSTTARFCRSAGVQTVTFQTDPLYLATGEPVTLTIAGTRANAVAEACAPTGVPGVERCGAVRADVATGGLPDAVEVRLESGCPGDGTTVATLTGPTITRMNPGSVKAGDTTRVRADGTTGDIQEGAIRRSGSGEPFVIVPTRPLGGVQERAELTVPTGLVPGNYDVRIRDEACETTGFAILEVTP